VGAVGNKEGLTPKTDQPYYSIQEQKMKPKVLNAYTIAVQAYIYGFAAVEMERTRRILTNTAVTTPKQVPMNQILHNKR
jgi:hypothetical protein